MSDPSQGVWERAEGTTGPELGEKDKEKGVGRPLGWIRRVCHKVAIREQPHGPE